MNMKKFLTRNYSFLGASLMMEAWNDADTCAAMTGVADGARDVEYIPPVWWLDETWIESVSIKYLTAEPTLFWDFLRNGQDTGNRLSVVSRELYENAGAAGPHFENFTNWAERFHQNATFLLVTHPLAKSVELRLRDALKKYGVPPSELDQVLLDLSITRKSNASEEENFDLFFIQHRMRRPGFDLDAALKEHTRKHAYLKYRDPFLGGYTAEDFRERLKLRLELPNYFQPYADIIGQFQEDEKELAALLDECVFYRTFRTERSYESLYFLERGLAIIEEANGMPPHELSFYAKAELAGFLRDGVRIEPQQIAERRRGFAMTLHDRAVSVMTEQVLQSWAASRCEQNSPPVREVRGLTAYRGIVTGRARVIMSAAEQDSVNPGDILVVPMTTPDYLPSMQKAAAFVTDEGGVICHAAIIARELKKPCVIGTKKATSVFKTGDRIEVDGFTGVVRLLPHTESTGETGK
jgi:phosphohistidine swiveling domain-containing protein